MEAVRYRPIMMITVSVAALGACGGALAQASSSQSAPTAITTIASPPAAAAQGTDLTEVVVTAQRRESTISKTPVAISAFNGDQLRERSIRSETDLQSAVPGLTVKTGESASQVNYAIRGQTLDVASGSASGVLTYLNDIALTTQSPASFYDLSSIQVVKGPQGTLFGRNDTGGAVLYTTVQPNYTFGGYLDARVGNYDAGELQGAVTVPLIDQKVSLRLAGDYRTQQGYVTNEENGDHLGNLNHDAIRATLRFDINSRLTSTFMASFVHDGGTELNGELYSVYGVGQTNNGFNLNSTAAAVYGPGSMGATIAGHPEGIVAFLQEQKNMGLYKEELPFTPEHRSHELFLSNMTSYEIAPGLQFKNIIGVSNSVTRQDASLSGSPFGILQLYSVSGPYAGVHYNDDQWSEEAQILGQMNGNQLKYIVGFYASSFRQGIDFPVAFGADLPTPIASFHYNTINQDNSQALFAQATYDLSELTKIQGLSFTLGGRYTEEQVRLGQKSDSLFAGAKTQEQDKALPSWQIGLNYQITPALLIYAVNRGSWRTGNFNGNAPPVPDNFNEFKPEKTIDYEVGGKYYGRIFDRSVHIDLALYDQETNDVQRDVYLEINGAPASFTRNVPRSNVKGVELDGEIKAAPWLTLGGATAYTNAVYTSPVVEAFGQTLTFTTFPDTPSWSGSLYGQVELPTPTAWGSMDVRADAYAQTKEYFTSLASSLSPGTRLPGYGLLNLRYDWRHIYGTDVTFSAFATNLLDKGFFQGGFANGPSAGVNVAVPGAPRMFGAELNYKF